MIFYYLKYVVRLFFKTQSNNVLGGKLLALIESDLSSLDDSAIQKRLKSLKDNQEKINLKDLGAGSKVGVDKQEKTIGDIAKTVSVQPKFGRLFTGIISEFNYKNVVELGTSFGIGTSYLAMSKANVVTVEGCKEIAGVAVETFRLQNLDNVTSLIGEFSERLEEVVKISGTIDFVYIDGNHSYEATLAYFDFFKQYTANHTCFVFDDIYWSKGMQEAWVKIKSQVDFSIDLFRAGIVLTGNFDQAEHHTRWLR